MKRIGSMIRSYQSDIIIKHALALATTLRMFETQTIKAKEVLFKGDCVLMQRIFLEIALDHAQRVSDNFKAKAIESMLNTITEEEKSWAKQPTH
jgi:hypothetical protein